MHEAELWRAKPLYLVMQKQRCAVQREGGQPTEGLLSQAAQYFQWPAEFEDLR
jgi:hypothetical protein